MKQAQPGEPVAVRRRWRISLIWLVPAIALVTSISMLIQTWISAGPEITILFQNAAGLEAGKTAVKYKDVTVGMVKNIALNPDSSQVQVSVQLNKNAEYLAHADSRFWVVRPRLGISGVTGIDTLLSGAYIGADKGHSSEASKVFTGLEIPPPIINDRPGRRFVILTDDLGSLDIGSPVYYRRVQVGRVAAYQLSEDGRNVSLQVFIDAPYDRLVTPDTRFWNASGMDLSIGTDGFRLKTQTVAAIMAGGIAFLTPDNGTKNFTTNPTTEYLLAKDQETATAPPDGPSVPFRLRFERSVHGLAVGASVEFSSVSIGKVTSINLDYSPSGYRFPTIVDIKIFPNRLGHVLDKLPKPTGEGDIEQATAEFTRNLVAHGLRAQAIPSNFLTGQLYISLDFVPDAPKVVFDLQAQPLLLPTISGGLDKLQEQMAGIVSKINKMPLESIGAHLDTTLVEMNKTLLQINHQTLPAANLLIQQSTKTTKNAQDILAEDSPLMINFSQTLQELTRTLHAVRSLATQIDRHPESLLRGRPTGPPLQAISAADSHKPSTEGLQK